jgi:hypothetical protein
MNTQMPYMASSYYPSTYPTMMPQQLAPPPKTRYREGTTVIPANQVAFNKHYLIGNLREGIARLLLIVSLFF